MKRLIFILCLGFSLAGYCQQLPSTYPQRLPSYTIGTYVQANSLLFTSQDTFYAKYPSIVCRPDNTLWFSPGNGGYWSKLGTGGSSSGLDKGDSVSGGYYPYSSNPKGYVSSFSLPSDIAYRDSFNHFTRINVFDSNITVHGNLIMTNSDIYSNGSADFASGNVSIDSLGNIGSNGFNNWVINNDGSGYLGGRRASFSWDNNGDFNFNTQGSLSVNPFYVYNDIYTEGLLSVNPNSKFVVLGDINNHYLNTYYELSDNSQTQTFNSNNGYYFNTKNFLKVDGVSYNQLYSDSMGSFSCGSGTTGLKTIQVDSLGNTKIRSLQLLDSANNVFARLKYTNGHYYNHDYTTGLDSVVAYQGAGTSIDSTIWQTKYRSDTNRVNVYKAIASLNADSSFATGFATRKTLANDSLILATAINTKGSGTVTSIATGYGLSGGTITSTGTVTGDTTKLIPYTDTLKTSYGIATQTMLSSKSNLSGGNTFTGNQSISNTLTSTASNVSIATVSIPSSNQTTNALSITDSLYAGTNATTANGLYMNIKDGSGGSTTRQVDGLNINIPNGQLVFTNTGTIATPNTITATPSLFLNRTGSSGNMYMAFGSSGTIYSGMLFNGGGEVRFGGLATGGYYPTFYYNNSEGARISTGGKFLMNTTTDDGSNQLQVNGSIKLETAGNKINIATGSNASVGQSVAMTAGSVTISTTAVTANSIIMLTGVDASAGTATDGALSVGTITAGTSFVINSANTLDTRKVNWIIIN